MRAAQKEFNIPNKPSSSTAAPIIDATIRTFLFWKSSAIFSRSHDSSSIQGSTIYDVSQTPIARNTARSTATVLSRQVAGIITANRRRVFPLIGLIWAGPCLIANQQLPHIPIGGIRANCVWFEASGWAGGSKLDCCCWFVPSCDSSAKGAFLLSVVSKISGSSRRRG